ncbi:MAG: hypothetical protein A3J74_08205 [Elusimicrobia bacterium RIFCSPHIGHO2_02_FULL_57_9]|nr:MAG: hypothetical protein A3J74_08205 [Elusimicrobia bacterium RIFCSPHIGHO2_02_FULL_57_9]
MKRVVLVAVSLYAAAVAHGFGGEDLQYARENKAWALLLKVQQEGSGDVRQFLDRFLRTFPSGHHAVDAQFAMAEEHYLKGQFTKALPMYEALANGKDSTYTHDAWLRMAEIHYNIGDIPKAQKTFEKLVDKTGRTLVGAEALYGLALCFMHNKDYRQAVNTINRLVAKYPAYVNVPKIRELMGILRFEEKNYRETIAALEGIFTPVAAFYRGLSFFHQKQYQEAAQSFNTLADMPSSPYAEMGLYLKAECFRMVQNAGLTAQAYSDFVSRFPNSRLKPQALINQARALNVQGRVAEAMGLLRDLDATAMSKDAQINALYLEAEIAAQQGDYEKARELPAKAQRLLGKDNPERYARIHIILTYYLLKIGKIKEATIEMRELLRQIPLHPLGNVAHLLLGYGALNEHDLRTAISSFETSFLKYEYSPLSDAALAMMLNGYFEAGNYKGLVTHANSVMTVVSSEYATQDMRWKAQSQMLIGEAYYRLKMFNEASRFYEQAMEEPALAEQARLFLAWSKYHEGKFAESLRLAQKIMGLRRVGEENRISAHLLLASSYFNQGNYEASIDAFVGFRQNHPNNAHVPECWLYEGWAKRQTGAYAGALKSWKNLVAQFPNDPEAQDAQIQIGLLYFQARKYKAATQEFAAFLTRWPQAPLAPQALWLLAQTYYNSQDDASAIKTYRAFLAQYPNHKYTAGAENQLMLTCYRQAMRSKNSQQLAQFVQMYPKSQLAPEAQYQLALDAFQAKQWAPAIDHFRKLLLQYPASSQAPLALLSVAQAQERLSKRAEAILEYKSLVDLFPTHPASLDAGMRLGALHFAAENFKEAAASFRFVIEREAPPQIKSSAMFNLGMSRKKERNYAEAVEAFNSFTSAYPENPKQMDALLEIAALYRLMDMPDKAAQAYQMVLRRGNLTPAIKTGIYNQTAELYRGMGNKEKAVAYYSELIPLRPANMEERLLGLAQLAAIHEEDEAWEKALRIYNQIRISGGKTAWVQSAAKRAKEIKSYLRAKKTNPAMAAASKQ